VSHNVNEVYSVYAEPRQRARKPHVCGACQETIPVGVVYTRVFALLDGVKSTTKRCWRCQAIHEHLRDMGWSSGAWPAEDLACGEEYAVEWGVEPPPEIAMLAFALPWDSGGGET